MKLSLLLELDHNKENSCTLNLTHNVVVKVTELNKDDRTSPDKPFLILFMTSCGDEYEESFHATTLSEAKSIIEKESAKIIAFLEYEPTLSGYFACYDSTAPIKEHPCHRTIIELLVVAESEEDALEQLYAKYPTFEKKGFKIQATLDLKEKSIEELDRSGSHDY
jgi:hypothetical protein